MACGRCSCNPNRLSSSPKRRPGRAFIALGAVVAAIAGAAVALQPKVDPAAVPEARPEAAAAPSPYVLGHTLKRIDGTEESLEKYKGQVVLIVNVASKCGNTPQYAGLQKLYTEKKDAGLVVLGFPANDFMSQEPGANKDIAEFCSSKYQVTFPMFEKIGVKGEAAHLLYRQLAAQPAPVGGEPDWNFTKYLVDRQGNVVARYKSKVKPDNAELVKKIDELLAVKK
jgi:glutathione peroxidase